jgi:hypothetical protein
MMGGPAALLARLAELEQQREDALRSKREIALLDCLHQWGVWQREGYAPGGIDYGRTPVLSSKQGSQMPAPEWYLTLCTAITLLPPNYRRDLERAFVEETHHEYAWAFDALCRALGIEVRR